MNELQVTLKARELVKNVAPGVIPCPIEDYANHIGAKIRVDSDMGLDEAGYTLTVRNKSHIVINGNDTPERQRFTACHELGHIVLGLPSEHGVQPQWSYRRRPLNEQHCDVFAAELLLPVPLFRPKAIQAEVGFSALHAFANEFQTSLTATGSRFAAVTDLPCAFVLSEGGKVRYASRSPSLRAANAWIAPRSSLPSDSLSAKVRQHGPDPDTDEIDADMWFSDWTRGDVLYEEAYHLAAWDQTLTLLWFEKEDLPPPPRFVHQDEDLGLKELDGVLPWPGKSRRR